MEFNFVLLGSQRIRPSHLKTGGLDIGSLRARDPELLTKWWWRFQKLFSFANYVSDPHKTRIISSWIGLLPKKFGKRCAKGGSLFPLDILFSLVSHLLLTSIGSSDRLAPIHDAVVLIFLG